MATSSGSGDGPVAEFCADLRQLRRTSGYDLGTLANELNISKSQLYVILNGEIKRPPDWTKVVGPLVAACTGGDARAINDWRRRHGVLVGVYEELSRRDRRGGQPGPPTPAPTRPRVIRTLPATTAAFTGRSDQIEEITRAASGPDEGIAIYAIGGMPGVGKTALAVHIGHLVADRFPDRQLFVDLHGHTPGRPPANPADVLATLLAADGLDPRYLPPDLDGRAAMWRDRMAGRRMLLILDNAADSGQVTPLLPGSARCLVLVTSRRFLGDLPVAVAEVALETPSPGDVQAMFAKLAPRAASEPAQVAELTALCGYLPLAVTLLARLFNRHPSWRMVDLIGETRSRLLTVSTENRTVAAAFDLSYQYLTAGQRRFLRLLSLHPGADIDPYAAAALTGLPLDEAAGHLDALHNDRLLAEPALRRYWLHDLIRQYARSLAAAEPAEIRAQAAGRLLDYYQHTAESADVYLTRHAGTAASRVPVPATAPVLTGRDQAKTWMSAERVNLLACIGHAADRQQHDRVTGLTAAIASYLRAEGLSPQAVTLHAAAAAAARRRGDRPGEATALLNLGSARQATGDYPGAAGALEQALETFREFGDRLGEANALNYLGNVRYLTDDCPGAVGALQQALETFREVGDRLGEANALRNLGSVWQVTGDYQGAAQVLGEALGTYREIGSPLGQGNALLSLGAVRRLTGDFPGATSTLEQALETFREVGDRLGETNALCNLGAVWQVTGDYQGAAAALGHALGIYRDLGNRLGEANTLRNLGEVRCLTDDFAEAAAALEQALDIARDLGDRLGETEALNCTGRLLLAMGDPRRASAEYQRALDVARMIDSRLEEAHALEGIGRCDRLTGSADAASAALRQALEIYRDIGAPDAPRLSAELEGPRG